MLIVAFLFIVLGALFLAVALIYVYWRRILRPVPKLDRDAKVRGLQANVEVLRDRHGIPHVYAENDADLFRALGFVHAQDRLWQMEQRRRVALGRLAEVFGEAALDADRFSRTIGLGRAARAELDRMDAPERQALEAYAAGVNEFIRQNPGKLAAEFNLLRVQPEPWSALDSVACLKLLAWSYSGNWESELVRLMLVAELGPERATELEPLYRESGTGAEGESVDGADRQIAILAQGMLADYERVRPWLGVNGHANGSNSWVIAPKRTATRTALLANDTHQGVQIPVQWYEAHLSSPAYEVSGATIPGVPGVWSGHNRAVAWGLTNAVCDVQDLYLEKLSPDNADQFEDSGRWLNAEIHDEPIRVRGDGAVHMERVRVSRHGPVLDSVTGGRIHGDGAQRALSLRWAGSESTDTFKALLALNRAEDWDAFRTALADWATPALNFTFADADGNIGYCVAGKAPIRGGGSGLVPAPGWDRAFDWTGFVPAAELPHEFNPPSGYVVAANARMNGSAGAHDLGSQVDPGWRAARLEDVILEKERLTLRDIAEMQMDTGSGFARSLAPWFGRLEPQDSYEKVAAGLLRKWDYRMAADSSAATVFQYAWRILLGLVYGDKLGGAYPAFLGANSAPLFGDSGFSLRSAAALTKLIEDHAESHWYADATTGRERDRYEVLSEALTLAVARLRKDLGDNARRWEWGRLHQVRFSHPLGGARMLRTFFNRGPFPVGGDATTPLQTGTLPTLPPSVVQVLPNYRQIIDTSDWDAAQACLTTGQSGHPLAANYADQVDMWREGAYHAMPWTRQAVDGATVQRMVLLPEAGSSVAT